jgi:hydrogenase maturation protein HypF
MSNQKRTLKLNIKGIVQGVGFRPFIYNLAVKNKLNGWVRNSSAGVDIEVSGNKIVLELFIKTIKNGAPPLSKIDIIKEEWLDEKHFDSFDILFSEDDPNSFIPISPDISICDDCLNELFDTDNKRYRYPFINCTNCGPRFTIIKSIPYDRPKTTMSSFNLCQYCADEYTDPTNRRFHAQPVACPECGPQISFVINKEVVSKGENALQQAREYIRNGKIIAVKGIGGYHLACDAYDEIAVSNLRERKHRIDKAFAVMSLSVDKVKEYGKLGDEEEEYLTSRERPIVILDQQKGSRLASSISPGQNTVGVMLPYTPLHYLLLEESEKFPSAIVMTSGNYSEEPIDIDNETAFDHLGSIADAFLINDRSSWIYC